MNTEPVTKDTIKKYKYTQCVDLSHKKSGKHIIQSYDKNLMDNKKIGNICVGLTYYEMKLFMKKMKKIGILTKCLNIFLYFMTAINGLMNLDVFILKLRLGEFMNHIALIDRGSFNEKR